MEARQVTAVLDWLADCFRGHHPKGIITALKRCADLLSSDVDAQLRPVCDFLQFAGLKSDEARQPKPLRLCTQIGYRMFGLCL